MDSRHKIISLSIMISVLFIQGIVIRKPSKSSSSPQSKSNASYTTINNLRKNYVWKRKPDGVVTTIDPSSLSEDSLLLQPRTPPRPSLLIVPQKKEHHKLSIFKKSNYIRNHSQLVPREYKTSSKDGNTKIIMPNTLYDKSKFKYISPNYNSKRNIDCGETPTTEN